MPTTRWGLKLIQQILEECLSGSWVFRCPCDSIYNTTVHHEVYTPREGGPGGKTLSVTRGQKLRRSLDFRVTFFPLITNLSHELFFFFYFFHFLMTYAPGDSTFSRSRLRKASHALPPFRQEGDKRAFVTGALPILWGTPDKLDTRQLLCELAGPRETGWQLLLCLSVPSIFWLVPVISK